MPRSYSMGKRAEAVATTRQRIMDAALVLYQMQGIAVTTMQDVARRADVAPGTVANHFGSAEALAAEAGQLLLTGLRLPPTAVFDGVDSIADRVRILARELARFCERSEPWFQVWRREPGSVAAWAEVERRYYREFGVLMRAAVGPLADDPEIVLVGATLIAPPVLDSLQAAGRSSEAAADLVASVLVAWLASRSDA
jgi:AcrR family transcriptional regulator